MGKFKKIGEWVLLAVILSVLAWILFAFLRKYEDMEVQSEAMRMEDDVLKDILYHPEKIKNFSHCMNLWPPRELNVKNTDGVHITVCGSIETIQYSTDHGDFNVQLQKEIK